MPMNRVEPGRIIQPRPINRLARFTEALLRWRSAPPLKPTYQGVPCLNMARRNRLKVLLSGTANPYSGTEIHDTANGSHATTTGGMSLTSNIYEENGKTGLAGKIAWVYSDAFGNWRFRYRRTSSVGCNLCFAVTGCGGNNLPGASVIVTSGGTTVGTCTTGSGGQCCVSLAAGTYNWQVSATNMVTKTGTATLACPTTLVNVSLLTAASAICCSFSHCPQPFPLTLHLTDAYGPVTLTWNATDSAWEGHHAITQPGQDPNTCARLASTTTTIFYTLLCTGGVFQLAVSYQTCTTGPATLAMATDTGVAVGTMATLTMTSGDGHLTCSPLSMTASWWGDFSHPGRAVPSDTTVIPQLGTITITP